MEGLINDFVNYLEKDKKVSLNTLQSYERDIRQFTSYINSKKLELSSVTSGDMKLYIEYMQLSGKAASSVSRSLASVRAYYTFLLLKGKVKENPACRIRAPRQEKRLPQILTPAEVDALLACPDRGCAKGVRDKAMLELLYATGIKVSEIIMLNKNDADLDFGYLKCIGESDVRIIPLGKSAVRALREYLTVYREGMLASEDEQAMFVNCTGTRMTRQGFWKVLKCYAAEAGIKKDITPHTLRHSFAAHLLENGADLASIREMLGHKDITSTQVYARLMKNHIREVYNKTHPRAL